MFVYAATSTDNWCWRLGLQDGISINSIMSNARAQIPPTQTHIGSDRIERTNVRTSWLSSSAMESRSMSCFIHKDIQWKWMEDFCYSGVALPNLFTLYILCHWRHRSSYLSHARNQKLFIFLAWSYWIIANRMGTKCIHVETNIPLFCCLQTSTKIRFLHFFPLNSREKIASINVIRSTRWFVVVVVVVVRSVLRFPSIS